MNRCKGNISNPILCIEPRPLGAGLLTYRVMQSGAWKVFGIFWPLFSTSGALKMGLPEIEDESIKFLLILDLQHIWPCYWAFEVWHDGERTW